MSPDIPCPPISHKGALTGAYVTAGVTCNECKDVSAAEANCRGRVKSMMLGHISDYTKLGTVRTISDMSLAFVADKVVSLVLMRAGVTAAAASAGHIVGAVLVVDAVVSATITIKGIKQMTEAAREAMDAFCDCDSVR